MNENDFDKFAESWAAAQEVTGSNCTDASLALAFKILERYTIDQVQDAIMLHLSDPQTGQFSPKPADVVKQITDRLLLDGRPSPDEAWAIAIQSMDENETVILNDEIAKSLEYSSEIYHGGDKVGARMAFRESYQKACAESRDAGQPVKWWPSLGHDKNRRKAALEKAVEQGKLQAEHASRLLPEPITDSGKNLIAQSMKQIGWIK